MAADATLATTDTAASPITPPPSNSAYTPRLTRTMVVMVETPAGYSAFS